MRKAIQSFCEANFGSEYTVANIGESHSIQLLSLAVKKTQSWWKRPFGHSETVLFGNLREFVKSSEVLNQIDDFLANAVRESSDYIKKAEGGVVKNRPKTFDVCENDMVEFKRSYTIGDIEVGKLIEESLEDQELRELLQMAELDQRWVEEYDFKKQTLFIVTGIVYSEKLQIVGEQQGETEKKTKVSLPGIFGVGTHSRNRSPSLPMRETKAPLLFKCCSVKYDSQENRLRLVQEDVRDSSHED